MGTKLGKGEFPQGHGPNDFECFGPAAVADDQFDGTRICDMGCFKQDGVDSNKFYHGAIVQSTKTKAWFAYFQWGRTGATSPDFQFVECSSEADAASEYKSQLRSKNAGRGEWVTVAGMKTLRAKAGKDCYLVRPQATRATGLPSAKTIQCNDGAKKAPVVVAASATTKGKKSSPTVQVDFQTMSLMRDLNVATISYTKGAMANDSLPTQGCIDDARKILGHALTRVGKVGNDVNAQVNDRDLKEMTSVLYSKIPKKKNLGAAASTWILSADNINSWQLDLDAFEAALVANLSSQTTVQKNPLEGLGVEMSWMDTRSPESKWVTDFATNSTKNRHGLSAMKIHNLWAVRKPAMEKLFLAEQEKIALKKPQTNERPMFRARDRGDLTKDMAGKYSASRTELLFHGTRSVNVSGILGKSLMLPRQLVGVQITGAMFGPGLYFADDWGKSAGYCSMASSYWARGSGGVGNRKAFMFLVDVILGRPHVCQAAAAYTTAPHGCDSVFGKAGSSLMNNEWIVYETPKHMLRYLIEFSA